MTQNTINIFTLIISIIAIILSFASFVVSLLGFLSDKYKLVSGYNFGITEIGSILVINIVNKGKRPISINNFYIECISGKNMFITNNKAFFSGNNPFPFRLEENESKDINLNLIDVINELDVNNEMSRNIIVTDKIGKKYKTKVNNETFKKFI